MEIQNEIETKEHETQERPLRFLGAYNNMIETDKERFKLFKFFVKKDYKNKYNVEKGDSDLEIELFKTYQKFVNHTNRDDIWAFMKHYASKHSLDIDVDKQILEEYKNFAKENPYSLDQIKKFVEDFNVKCNHKIDGNQLVNQLIAKENPYSLEQINKFVEQFNVACNPKIDCNQLVNQLIAKEYKEFATKHRKNLKLFEKFVKHYKDKYKIDIDIVYLHTDIKDITKERSGSIKKKTLDGGFEMLEIDKEKEDKPEKKVIDLLKTNKEQVYQDISNVGKIITATAQSDKPRGLILCSLDKAGNIIHTSTCILFKQSALAKKTDKSKKEEPNSNVDKHEQEEPDKSDNESIGFYEPYILPEKTKQDAKQIPQEADSNEDIKLDPNGIAMLWNDNFGGKTAELLKIVEAIVNGINNKKNPDELDEKYRNEFGQFLEILKQVKQCGDYTVTPGLHQKQATCYLLSTIFCAEMLKNKANTFYQCVGHRKDNKISPPLSLYRYTQDGDLTNLSNGELKRETREPSLENKKYLEDILGSTIKNSLDHDSNEYDLNTFSIKKLFKFLDKNWQQAKGYDDIISKIINGTLTEVDEQDFKEDISFVEELEKYNFYHNNIIQRQGWWDKALSFGDNNARLRRINQLAKMMNNCYTKNRTPEEKEDIKSGRIQREIVFNDCLHISNMRKRGYCGTPEVIE